MPTYEYECLECKHRFDVFQPITDEPVETCEKCGKKVRKIFNSAVIIFKGEGFYVNDYKRKKEKDSKCTSASEGSPACESCPAAQGD